MIRFENASYVYPDSGFPAVHNVTLSIKKGDFVAILGHNGSGKSTMAKLMNGILVPTDGSVSFCGMDTAKEENIFEIRKHIGMVFQNPDNQIVATIVEEDVAFGPENLGLSPDEIRERVDTSLRAVNMFDYRLHAPHLLSGGQKQRTAIAGIIAMRPDCIVLDEPTAMLDPSGRQEVMETVLKLNHEEGITIILITHFMQEAALADRVIVTEAGHIIMDGTPREVLTKRDKLKAAGLESPAITELLHSLRDAGMPVKTDIIDVEAGVLEIASLLK